MSRQPLRIAAISGVLALLAAPMVSPGFAQDGKSPADAAYQDIEQTLGIVPGFLREFPKAGIAGAWAEFKAIQLSPTTKLNGKTKELIGLAVAAQIPCQYCVYFHTAAAKANGATEDEIRETVAMAAIVRHWSTVLNGMQVDQSAFKSEVDTVLRLAAERAKGGAKSQ